MDEIIKREDALFGHISKLCLKYGEGWSCSNLRQIRQFYLAYANLTDGVCQIQFDLSWSHYLILMRIENHDALVELTLPKDANMDANIYASAYQLYLPNKALLQAKVKEWIEEFEENEEIKKLEEDK